MIDLSWANSALLNLGISSEVATDLPPLADHEPILTTIQWGTNDLPRDTPPFRWSTLNDELFRETIQGETRHVDRVTSTLSPLPSPAQLDELANSITQAISTALEASTKRAYPRPCGHKWWNQDCTRVVKMLRRVARDPTSTPEDIRDAKQALHRVVRHSKRQFWRSKVDEFEEPKDVFNAVSCSEDVEVNLEPINDPKLPFPAITEKEIYNAVAKPKNSTPGKDGVTTSILKKAWPSLGPSISTLYQHCLDQGWHPTPFRDASLVAIPKPGKRDRSSPQAYRLIALLSVLGKGLERLIAHRMAWIAIKHKVLHPQQFGALPLRSATDLAAALIHDEQGWPINVLQWVASFTQGRTASLRLGNHTSQTFQVPAGLPQGSPISPILFMLFIEPIFKQGSLRTRRGRFGYADDICQLVASPSLEENCTVLEHCTEELRQWGAREGLTFDFNKTELQHFTCGANHSNPTCSFHTSQGSHTVTPPPPGGATRWLGIWFDRRLSFSKHCKTLAAKTELQHFTRGANHSNPTCSFHTSQGSHTVTPPPPGGATRWLGIWFDRRLSFSKHCKTLAAKAKQTAAGIRSLANTSYAMEQKPGGQADTGPEINTWSQTGLTPPSCALNGCSEKPSGELCQYTALPLSQPSIGKLLSPRWRPSLTKNALLQDCVSPDWTTTIHYTGVYSAHDPFPQTHA
ncbi:hypothetical protein SI65_02382 [Aspergillus cristatus]|uniref:Reverse transcriptase domain-containing protein n=1 Tax=Aspergillus cristatus TaxID=573508 RepID=A0A1E3BKV4_ASPCR|nr:hypothetical protein SI65_02382 [Aspergillus cristatus]